VEAGGVEPLSTYIKSIGYKIDGKELAKSRYNIGGDRPPIQI
jgi:hypothetical protein